MHSINQKRENISRKQILSFARVIEPYSVNDFKNDYFFRKPLLIRGKKDKFSFLPQKRELPALFEKAEHIRAVFKDFRLARISPDDVNDMFSAGATICATGLESTHKALFALSKTAGQLIGFSGTVSVRAYWSPPGSGFDIHYDPRVATTLQIEGSKRWWFTTSAKEELPLGNSPFPLHKTLRKAIKRSEIRSVLLRPGDLLCLPPGTWHWARAERSSTESLAYNLAFDYMGGTVAEIIATLLERNLLRNPSFRIPYFKDVSVNSNFTSGSSMLEQACEEAKNILNQIAKDPSATYRLWQKLRD